MYNGMYKIRLNSNIIIDKDYNYDVAKTHLLNSLKNPTIGYKITRSFHKYWLASLVHNPLKDTIHINAEACFDELYLDGNRIILSTEYQRPDPRHFIQQPQILQAYLDIPPGTHLLISRISDFHLSKNFNPVISDSKTYEGLTLKKETGDIYFLIFLCSLYFLLLLFSIGIYLLWKDLTFFYYAIFCFVTWFHFSRNLGENYESFDFINAYLPWVFIKVPIFLLFYLSYTLFTTYFIKADILYPKEFEFAKIFLWALVILSLPEIYFLTTDQLPLSYSYYFSLRFVATLVGIYYLYRISKYRKDHLVMIMLIGGGGLLFSELFSSLFDRKIYRYIVYSTMLIEVVAFMYGIMYKLYNQTKERIHLAYEKQQNEQVIKELHDSTNILNRSFLQQQLNPHFIFNCLNSIKEMIVSNENTTASKYISKFSMLIRTMLDNSQKAEVTLSQSLDFIKQYLDMEKMRFDGLQYTIHLDEHVDGHDLSLPPTIIQPLVENAIIHGYENDGNSAKIDIKIYKNGDYFCIDVMDEGKGLNEAEHTKTKKGNAIATKNIQHQIQLINQKYGTDYHLQIIDRNTMGPNSHGVISRITFKKENLIQW